MTGSEKGHISMTSGELRGEAGRHRHHDGSWTPQVTQGQPPAHALPDPVPPPTAAETTVPGLHKFDLGSIPASVTPPSTWRKAAWFAVGASLAVVFGLAFAAAALVGRPRNTDVIDALPALPSAPVQVEPPAATSAQPTQPPTTIRSAERLTVSPTPTRADLGAVVAPDAPAGAPGFTVVPVPTNEAVAPPPALPPPAPPVRETRPKLLFTTTDPQQIGDRTEAFYKQVTADPAAAYEMTTGAMREQGEQAFRQRYADIRSVEVRRISIDPNHGTTTSEVKITKTDGSTFTEVRQLRFTSGSDPRISSELTH